MPLVRRLPALIAPGAAQSGAALYRRTRLWVVLAALAANTGGAIVVFVFAAWVVPPPGAEPPTDVKIANLAATGVYLLVALALGVLWGVRRLHGVGVWLRAEREPSAEERRVVVRAPVRVAQVVAVMWAGATVVFTALNVVLFSLGFGIVVGIVVFLGGITTAAVAYLLSERLLRTVTARALSSAPPDRPMIPGVVSRSLLAWALGTGVPLFGLMTVAVLALARQNVDWHQLSITILGLGGCSLVIGFLLALLAARATADPLVALRAALGKVEQGDYDVEVTVYDGSELGLVQAGFNRMAGELRERQRVREIFGAYVDQSVAEHILEEGVSLEGEEIDVTALFLDVRGFTSLAESMPAKDVVGRLNRLFEAVVPIVHEHEGHVDKFVGDGLLAVFGAPQRQEAHADEALAAAYEIARTVAEDDELDLEVGIGLSSGEVIAGNVGGSGRLEFSVIGDAVNTAARVEAATNDTGDAVLLTEATAERLKRDDVELESREDVELRGKSEPVKLFAPKLPVEAGD